MKQGPDVSGIHNLIVLFLHVFYICKEFLDSRFIELTDVLNKLSTNIVLPYVAWWQGAKIVGLLGHHSKFKGFSPSSFVRCYINISEETWIKGKNNIKHQIYLK